MVIIEMGNTIKKFIREYPRFSWVILGMILLTFSIAGNSEATAERGKPNTQVNENIIKSFKQGHMLHTHPYKEENINKSVEEKRIQNEQMRRQLEQKRQRIEMIRRAFREQQERSQGVRLCLLKLESCWSENKIPELVLIPAGEALLGEEGSLKSVYLDTFYMDKYEVTQAEYEAVMGINPSRFKGPNLPVEKVTWNEANEFCQEVDMQLPTSAQWEKAARGGTTSKFYWGNELRKNQANCNGCGSKWDGLMTASVGSFALNKFGLHDMVGNVWEWVQDKHNENYRVLRGGSWIDDAIFVQSDGFYFVRPDNRASDIGFRCVIDLDSIIIKPKRN